MIKVTTFPVCCRLYSNDMDNPLKFSKEDVRTHLAELGYSNIEGNQLDEFCEDLKRLIKYEEKKQNIGRKLLLALKIFAEMCLNFVAWQPQSKHPVLH